MTPNPRITFSVSRKRKSKKKLIKSVHFKMISLIYIQQEQLVLQQDQGHRTQQFLDTMLEKQNELEQAEREKDRKFLLELGKLFSGK